MGTEPAPVPRPSARVLLLDDRDRLLLFSGVVSDPSLAGQHVWVLPGGGAEPGETAAATAARELYEETGLRVRPEALGAPVAVSRGVWGDGTARYDAEDFVYALRIARWEVVTDGFTPVERAQVTGHRWWSLAELQQTDETVFPRRLASLVARLLDGDPPAAPLELPW